MDMLRRNEEIDEDLRRIGARGRDATGAGYQSIRGGHGVGRRIGVQTRLRNHVTSRPGGSTNEHGIVYPPYGSMLKNYGASRATDENLL